MEKLEIIYLPVGQLRKLPDNPRQTVDPQSRGKLKKLIARHGFQNPLQVFHEENGFFTILCGNHRFEAGQSMGMEEFPCLLYKGDRKQALARAISDNKSSLWTQWDIPVLKDILAELDDGELDMELTGFSAPEILALFERQSETEAADLLYETKFEVVIECRSEKEQQDIYEDLKKRGYKCRVLIL